MYDANRDFSKLKLIFFLNKVVWKVVENEYLAKKTNNILKYTSEWASA